jgi:hypothetical protein
VVGQAASFRAWLSTTQDGAVDRLKSANPTVDGWIRTDGRPFGASLSRITGMGEIFYPLRLDESANDVSSGFDVLVATGTDSNGLRGTKLTASDWTSATAMCTAGVAEATTYTWTVGGDFQCNDTKGMHLYCFATQYSRGLDVAHDVPATHGLYAFVSHEPFVMSTATTPDQLCQGEARMAGTFRALIATQSASAIDRANPMGGPWIRLDGMPWVLDLAALRQGATLTSLSVDSTPAALAIDVWTGSPDLTTKATTDCAGWTATSGSATFGHSQYSNSSAFGNTNTKSCGDASTHLYCIQVAQ